MARNNGVDYFSVMYLQWPAYTFTVHVLYAPNAGPISGNQDNRKLRIFDQNLEERHSLFKCYFDKYSMTKNKAIMLIIFPLHILN